MPQSDYKVNITVAVKDESSQPAKKAHKSIITLANAFKGLVAVKVAKWGVQNAVALAKIGASAERQANALDNLAAAAGTSGDAIVKAIQETSNFTIDRMTAMQAANRAMVMDVAQTPEQFERLTRVATALGRAMGQDAAKSMDDFVTAAGRQSKMIADNLGLIVNAEDAYDRYAMQVGKTADQLTDAEKKQAFLNEMLVQGEAKMADLGDQTLDAAGSFEQVDAAWSDAKTSLGLIVGMMVQATGIVPKLAQETRRLADDMSDVAEAGGPSFRLYLQAMEEGTRQREGSEAVHHRYLMLLRAERGYYDDLTTEIDRYAYTLEQSSEIGRYNANAVQEQNTSYSELSYVTKEVQDNLNRQVVSQGQIEHTILQASEAIRREGIPSQNELMQSVTEATRALEDEARAAGEASVAQLDLAASLKGASEARIASAAIGQLKVALEEGEISFDQYTTAVSEVQLAFGLADEKSMFLAANLGELTSSLIAGTLKAGKYDEALRTLIDASENVATAFGTIKAQLDALPEEKVIRIRYELSNPPKDIARQHGGPVQAGVPYIVGEAGPELFVPYTAGQIVSNSQTYNSQDTYNLMTASASSVAMTRRRQRISRLMG